MAIDNTNELLLSNGLPSDSEDAHKVTPLQSPKSPNQHDEHIQLLITNDNQQQQNNSLIPATSNGAAAPPINLLTIMVAGAGFACDSYDLFIMNAVLVVMGCSISDPTDPMLKSVCHLTASTESTLATAVLIGSMLGQLTFGTIADHIGRKKSFIATLSLLIVGGILSSAAVPVAGIDLITMLAVARFVLGVGIGGEYPLSATVSSEASTETAGRGKRVAAVFSMQSVGVLLAPIVVLLLLQFTSDYEVVWRLSLGIGALPGLVMLYWRFTMKESQVYQDAAHARTLNAAVPDRRALIKAQWRDLLGTAGNWWLFDIVFYANSFFSSKVTSAFLPVLDNTSDTEAKHEYLTAMGYSLGILAVFGMPGYIAGTFLVDRWGRRKLQLFGYAGMVVTYLLMSMIDPEWLRDNRAAFYLIYGASFFFCNCGPNVTTFVIPSEIFHTDIRSTCHGVSACAGKFGAAIGAALYPFIYAASDESIRPAMLLSSAISVAGFVFTWFITRETKDIDLTSRAISVNQENQNNQRSEQIQLTAQTPVTPM